ncbi:DUF6194 family protein [Fulvivirga maritima]|uniref:DUF6194 family protein n=1 Tax=Fulvivirga maritima TaxID=2904247 RepID=UPI001F23675D|nr:DUF6194 family protein [Fulvivirga maritima]UII26030.1 DUF6194 family protein [Fulvivirga maritima]
MATPSTVLSKAEIIEDIKSQFQGLVLDKNWGEEGLFYNPEGKLAKGVYLLTFKEKDGPNDSASNTNREGVYRLNLGISEASFLSLFREKLARPKAGNTINMNCDFTEFDKVMPHPVYGWMCWIGVLNPTKVTYSKLLFPLISESFQIVCSKYDKRIKSLSSKRDL